MSATTQHDSGRDGYGGDPQSGDPQNAPMRDLAKSMIRFSWATGLLGVAQVAGWARGSARVPSKIGGGRARRKGPTWTGGLDAVTWTAQGQLGELLGAAFHAGDDLQEEWLDLLADGLSPGRWGEVVARLGERSADSLRIARPTAEGSRARQELRNKFEVYRWVKGARQWVGLPPRGELFSLESYVTKAYELDAYQALWVIEGLAHDYAESALADSDPPGGLLRGEAIAGLPESCLPMLHGGLGLALAERMFGGLTPGISGVEARQALESFVEACHEHSMDRHVDSAIESLGLDARCFFPDLVETTERGLQHLGHGRLRRLFWHGVGRAIYFLPVNFIPGYGSLRHALLMARRESPDEQALANALAGVSYAFTMVNMSHPGILESLLRDHGPELRTTAFEEGVVASILMRHEITPEAGVLRSFIEHEPDPGARRHWQEMVREPAERALEGLEPFEGRSESAATEVYRSLYPQGGVG